MKYMISMLPIIAAAACAKQIINGNICGSIATGMLTAVYSIITYIVWVDEKKER